MCGVRTYDECYFFKYIFCVSTKNKHRKAFTVGVQHRAACDHHTLYSVGLTMYITCKKKNNISCGYVYMLHRSNMYTYIYIHMCERAAVIKQEIKWLH